VEEGDAEHVVDCSEPD